MIITSVMLCVVFDTFSQGWQKAVLTEELTIKVENVYAPAGFNSEKQAMDQMTGFPVAVTGNASFKNMRNLTLADINGDQIQDIVFVADSKLYVWTYQGMLWEKTIIGTGIYPPSVADINMDGFNEIVLVTGGLPANGRTYTFDKDGNELPGWPVNFSSHWMMCAPALTDVDNDSIIEIIVCERYTSTVGRVHILRIDGTSFSTNWPVSLDGIPAFTPSVGDVDNDGVKEIVAYSTKSRYIFELDGQPMTGFPLNTEPEQKYSYQSPVIADLNSDDQYEVIGATHGDLPKFYVMDNSGNDYTGWPITVPDSNWTYSTPTVVKINGEYRILMSRPIGSEVDDMLYCWDAEGNMQPGFPVEKSGGLEGYISVADINNDNDFELVFGANMLDSLGYGFINAYNISDGTPVNGFPIRPRGWTFMNGVCIGDVNGDAAIDLVSLTYTNSFGANTDTVYINVYETNSPYTTEKVLWGTYKGTNDRSGYVSNGVSNVEEMRDIDIMVYPNPCSSILNIELPSDAGAENSFAAIYDITGRHLFSIGLSSKITRIDVSGFEKGMYIFEINYSEKSRIKKLLVK